MAAYWRLLVTGCMKRAQAAGITVTSPLTSGAKVAGSHMHRVARRERAFPFSGEWNAMEVANHRPAVGPGLVEQPLHGMGQQRGSDRDEQSMIAGAL
ncbi:hypothetical protein I6F13_36595 [Bradyrhizobium sp. IC4061]|nr:hypothetical protein [Bradyrhizobium sp. IC4061]